MFIQINLTMKNKKLLKKGFTLPEVLISIVIIILVIVTATNLLVSSIRANTLNTNKIVAFNLAQEAIEGMRNIRDSHWMHNQYWRGSDKNLFGISFAEDGKYIIKKSHNLKTAEECKVLGEQTNSEGSVQNAAPFVLIPYTDSDADLYLKEDGFTEYAHDLSGNKSKYRRWIEIETLPYDLATEDDEDKLKMNVTAVVEWLDRGRYSEFRLPVILTDWKAGPL